MFASSRLSLRSSSSIHAVLLCLPLLVASAGCCKKGESSGGTSTESTGAAANPAAPAARQDGSAWAGTYTRYAEAVRKDGKKIASATTTGRASLTMAAGQATYVVEYGPNLQNKITQVYTFTPDSITAVKNGHNVQLTWQSMNKVPPNAAYNADSKEPTLKIRGEGDKRHIELEFLDTQGVRADIDFSVNGVDLKKAKLDEDFE